MGRSNTTVLTTKIVKVSKPIAKDFDNAIRLIEQGALKTNYATRIVVEKIFKVVINKVRNKEIRTVEEFLEYFK